MDPLTDLTRQISVYGFRPRKKLSQFFLVDQKSIDRIIELLDLSPEDRVLEIGAGTGFISKEVLKSSHLTAVELDESLIGVLEKDLPQKNLELLQGNFLSLDFKEKNFSKIVSAVPYHLSSEFIYWLFSISFEKAVLVFQKEFAEKLTAKPIYREYSAITVLANSFFEVTKKDTLSNQAFFPKPSCFSSIVVVSPRKGFIGIKEQQLFIEFVKSLFRYRNKNMSNALKNSFPFLEKKLKLSKEEFLERISSLNQREEKVCTIESSEFPKIFARFLD